MVLSALLLTLILYVVCVDVCSQIAMPGEQLPTAATATIDGEDDEPYEVEVVVDFGVAVPDSGYGYPALTASTVSTHNNSNTNSMPAAATVVPTAPAVGVSSSAQAKGSSGERELIRTPYMKTNSMRWLLLQSDLQLSEILRASVRWMAPWVSAGTKARVIACLTSVRTGQRTASFQRLQRSARRRQTRWRTTAMTLTVNMETHRSPRDLCARATDELPDAPAFWAI